MKVKEKTQREILREKMIATRAEAERLGKLYSLAQKAAEMASFDYHSYADVESARQLATAQADEARVKKAEQALRENELGRLRDLGLIGIRI